MSVTNRTVPVSEFKSHASDWLDSLSEGGAPVVITQKGRATGVLISPATYERLVRRELFLKAVDEGIEDVRSNRLIPHDRLMARLRHRFDRG